MCKHCYDGWNFPNHSDFIRGGVDVSDFDEELPYKKNVQKGYRRKYTRVQTRPGCPGNDYKAHVYVWTEEREDESTIFFKFYGYHKSESHVCAGCGKVNGSRLSERYSRVKARKYSAMYGDEFDVTRGAPVPRYRWRSRKPTYRYWTWERYDEKFVAFRNDYITRRGLPAYLSWN